MRNTLRRFVPLAVAALWIPAAASALDATVEILLAGEVITDGGDPTRPGQVPIVGHGGGISTPYDPLTGLPNDTRQYRPVTVVKPVDKATPKIHEAVATGQHFDEVKIHFYRSDGGTTVEYFVIEMTDVIVSSWQTGGSDDTDHLETVSFNFAQIQFDYNGTDGSSSSTDTWDAGGSAP